MAVNTEAMEAKGPLTPEEARALHEWLKHMSLPNKDYLLLLRGIQKLGAIGGVK